MNQIQTYALFCVGNRGGVRWENIEWEHEAVKIRPEDVLRLFVNIKKQSQKNFIIHIFRRDEVLLVNNGIQLNMKVF